MKKLIVIVVVIAVVAVMACGNNNKISETVPAVVIEKPTDHDVEKELGGADIDGWFYADPEEYETEEELKERLEPEVEEEDSNIAEYLDTDIQRNATPYIKDSNKLNIPHDTFQYNN